MKLSIKLLFLLVVSLQLNLFSQILNAGFESWTASDPDDNNPSSFSLTQNYSNPFNPSTKINFSITEQSYVELIAYDILGNEVRKLVSDNFSAGEYWIDFNAENLPAGVYFARLSAGKYSNTIKMTLMK